MLGPQCAQSNGTITWVSIRACGSLMICLCTIILLLRARFCTTRVIRKYVPCSTCPWPQACSADLIENEKKPRNYQSSGQPEEPISQCAGTWPHVNV
ncbi:hypothetical protein F4604DRAFT_1734384 [Suillus subluteus]|nr:hypothetical protein F4604DRAFT_1734384 [Suillus subluteus]